MPARWLFFYLFLTATLLAGCAQVTPAPAVKLTRAPQTETPGPLHPTNLPSASPTLSPQPTPSPTLARPQIPDPNAYTWQEVANGLTAPVDVQSARDGSGRLFIVEKRGRIRILQNDQVLAAPFLDISERVGSQGSEQGLLGLAFHPRFAQNGYFFVNYTDKNGNTHIARFTAGKLDAENRADPASEKKLLLVQQPFPNHNGGALAFGLDGYLYIGLGDGGSAGDPYGNAQSGHSLLGKLLRVDVDTDQPYGIPADNPFASTGIAEKEIWASGLRNPWRFSFDRKTGDLWIGDVGQNLWEEIDYVPAGKPGGLNFGWNKMEATHPFKGGPQAEFTSPVAEYPHGAECAVTGGEVYRGAALPAWQGIYIFGDYCSGAIWGLPSPPQNALPVMLFQTGFKISTFGQDDAGELYVVDYQGSLYRLEKQK